MVLYILPSNSLLHSPPRTRLCRSNGHWDSPAALEDRSRSGRMARAVTRAIATRPENSCAKTESKKRRRRGNSPGADLWSLGHSIRAAAIFRTVGKLSKGSCSDANRDHRSIADSLGVEITADWESVAGNGDYHGGQRDRQEVDTLELNSVD